MEDIRKASNKTLWILLSDIAGIIGAKDYDLDVNDPVYRYWHDEMETIRNELNNRTSIF